jgi:2-keto-4-pentenoate hydratase
MLMSTQINRYAHQLLDARRKSRLIPPLSQGQSLAQDDAYGIAQRIFEARIAEGEQPVGRKIGFVNRVVWPHQAQSPTIHTPIWTPIFNSTVHYAEENVISLSLKGMMQPRIEAEIVFRLRKAPAVDASMHDLADCIEWMAHGIELTSCPFQDWRFETTDAIAAFGLHGALIIGEPRTVSSLSRSHLESMMKGVTVSLACDSVLVTAGFGSDILNSPLHALWHLHQMLQNQTRFAPLQAGEIITTGSWTDGRPVSAGQVWQTAYSGIALPGLTLGLKK